jgi:hypothetical protein
MFDHMPFSADPHGGLLLEPRAQHVEEIAQFGVMLWPPVAYDVREVEVSLATRVGESSMLGMRSATGPVLRRPGVRAV